MHVYKWYLHAALASALLLVEASAFSKLSGYLGWGYAGLLAYSTALAFLALMVASVVSLSLDLDEALLVWVRRAVVILLLVQGVANMLLVYQYEWDAMPTQVVMRFFPFLDQEVALRVNAIIQGLTLSFVSLAFWNTWALMLKREWAAKRQGRAVLQQLDEILK
jgi:hypothetical protein